MASVEAVERRRANRAALRRHKEHVARQRLAPIRSVLSSRILERIDAIIRNMEGGVDPDVLDYRFWECLKCRLNPRQIIEQATCSVCGNEFKLPHLGMKPSCCGMAMAIESMTHFGWWKRLDYADRAEVNVLSAKCNRDFTCRRVRAWAKVRR